MTDSVSYYDGKQWRSMPIGGGPDRYSMIGATTGIAQDKAGRLLFCTSSSGVWVYDDNTWYRLPDSPKDCIAIAVDYRDSIYLGTWNSGIYLYQDKKWSHWKTADGLAGNGIRSINQDNDGTIWVGTERGASCFNGAEWKSFTIENGFPAHEVQAITKDKEGTLWFGVNGGVCRYDGTNWRCMLVNTGENNTGWASNYVLAMCQDREGNLWAATMTGVSRYDGVKWQSTLSLIPENGIFVKDIVQDKIGRICIVFRDETVKVYDGKDWNTLSTMHRDYLKQDADGMLWFSDHRYFYSYDGAKWNTLKIDGVSLSELRNLFKARDGSIWIVTYGYIYRYDGKKLEKYTLQDGPCEYFVNWIFEDSSGNIWFGAASSGIFVYTPPK